MPRAPPIAAVILSRSDDLALAPDLTEPALTDTVQFALSRIAGRYETFQDGAVGFPWQSVGALTGTWMAKRRGLPATPAAVAAARVFCSGLFRLHLRAAVADLPGASMKVEGAMSHATAVASERGTMILGPDRLFDGQFLESPSRREVIHRAISALRQH